MIPESGSDEFIADLKMTKTHWFYYNSSRALLVVKGDDKDDAKPEAVRKEWRSLGASAVAAL